MTGCATVVPVIPQHLRKAPMRTPRMAVAALLVTAPLLLATPVSAHDGAHPFRNCSDARENGYSNIPLSDTEHYAPKLDRDKDGWGCDKHGTLANDGKAGTGSYAQVEDSPEDDPTTAPAPDKNLAETGGSSSTPYIATAGGVLLFGGGALALRKRRRTT